MSTFDLKIAAGAKGCLVDTSPPSLLSPSLLQGLEMEERHTDLNRILKVIAFVAKILACFEMPGTPAGPTCVLSGEDQPRDSLIAI